MDEDPTSTYKKYGLEGIKKKLDEYRKTQVRIAVIGQSGCGKSTFINRLRSLTPEEHSDESYYAEVGVTETTTKSTSYEFPGNPLILLFDLPGAGTANFPIDTYAAKMDFDNFHAFVILTKDRFQEVDLKIADELRARKKPFFFARTKMDATMKEEAENKPESFTKRILRTKSLRTARRGWGIRRRMFSCWPK
jgi:GTP-binding protein EngB required for normal cell division